MSVRFKFLNALTAEALCSSSVMLRLSSAYFSFTCIRHLGSGEHPSRFQEHGYAEGPGKLRRLTKGVSISLPSSPLFPRQADIIPSQSCIRFTGGWIWRKTNINKVSLGASENDQKTLRQRIVAKNASRRLLWFPSIRRKLLCVQLFHACDSKYKRIQIVHPQGPKTKQQIVRLNDWTR